MERESNSFDLPMYLFKDETSLCIGPGGEIQHPRGSLQGVYYQLGQVLFTLNGESIYFTQEQVAELLPLLQTFVETGQLP